MKGPTASAFVKRSTFVQNVRWRLVRFTPLWTVWKRRGSFPLHGGNLPPNGAEGRSDFTKPLRREEYNSSTPKGRIRTSWRAWDFYEGKMDRANLAERILRSVCTRARAEEIVGDLLEQSDSSSDLAFWFSIWRIEFRMGWRWILAAIAAFWAFALPIQIFIRFLAPLAGPQPRNVPWAWASFALIICSVFVFSATVLNLVRFGLKSSLNGMAFFLGSLFLIAAFFTRFPNAKYLVPLAIAAVVVGLLLYAPTRQPLVSVLCVTGVQAAVCLFCFALISCIHSKSVWIATGSWAISIGAAAYTLSAIRKRTGDEFITPHCD